MSVYVGVEFYQDKERVWNNVEGLTEVYFWLGVFCMLVWERSGLRVCIALALLRGLWLTVGL